jgi:hypothetical protein
MIPLERDFEDTSGAKQIGCHHAVSPSAGEIGCLPYQNNFWKSSGLAVAMGGALVGSPRQARGIGEISCLCIREFPQAASSWTSDKKYYVNLDLKFVHFSNSMVLYVGIGDLIRDFGHAYSAVSPPCY